MRGAALKRKKEDGFAAAAKDRRQGYNERSHRAIACAREKNTWGDLPGSRNVKVESMEIDCAHATDKGNGGIGGPGRRPCDPHDPPHPLVAEWIITTKFSG